MCAWAADLSNRMRRFEPVPDDELAAFEARKESVVERIEPGFYEDYGDDDAENSDPVRARP